jgi:hypothetical protein
VVSQTVGAGAVGPNRGDPDCGDYLRPGDPGHQQWGQRTDHHAALVDHPDSDNSPAADDHAVVDRSAHVGRSARDDGTTCTADDHTGSPSSPLERQDSSATAATPDSHPRRGLKGRCAGPPTQCSRRTGLVRFNDGGWIPRVTSSSGPGPAPDTEAASQARQTGDRPTTG